MLVVAVWKRSVSTVLIGGGIFLAFALFMLSYVEARRRWGFWIAQLWIVAAVAYAYLLNWFRSS